jgi:hypothetical protein
MKPKTDGIKGWCDDLIKALPSTAVIRIQSASAPPALTDRKALIPYVNKSLTLFQQHPIESKFERHLSFLDGIAGVASIQKFLNAWLSAKKAKWLSHQISEIIKKTDVIISLGNEGPKDHQTFGVSGFDCENGFMILGGDYNCLVILGWQGE